ncbi:hypothetical protein RBB50_004793 [Rhinocladiella similis]
MPLTCRTKVALLKGVRPHFSNQQHVATTQNILSSACSTSCIYCDIWKLAALIASHVPLRARYNLPSTSPTTSPTSSRPSSPISFSPTFSTSTPHADMASVSRKIEAQIQAQRSQLNSILSICTVSGADECEGLRMAHDRCSATVEDLLDQEEDLEEALLEELREQQSVNRYECEYDHHGYASREYLYPDIKDSSYCDSYSYPYAYPYPYPYSQERRPSAVDVAI